MLIELVSISIIFFIVYRALNLTEFTSCIVLLIIVIVYGIYFLEINPINCVHNYELIKRLIVYYFAIALTMPILFIKIPTLQLIDYLKSKEIVSKKDLYILLNKYVVTNKHLKLVDNKYLFNNKKITILGKILAFILLQLKYDK
jgi:hypothetical protein